MWRRLTHHLRTIALVRSNPKPVRFVVASSTVPTNIRRSAVFVSRHFSTASGATIIVDDLMPIATGHEREELQAALTGKDVLEINYPSGPFGTKEEPAVVKSYYDKRIVGCPGVEGEHEHDVVWFWLEKGKPHECPVCSQYFVLEVVGPGGPLDDHGDDHHHKRPTLLNILVLELMV
ncbi:cytochrome c oxidase subunit 5b-2, mitochondrial-like isoform X1 [Primulina eburnea]|uniref:cytochrome c oxidase subunit 5b-2, mitochondrial-like isoform X1 n=1 Tax=Primulina eburnea TaxID=1245227 RepID=UPI003C6C86B7